MFLQPFGSTAEPISKVARQVFAQTVTFWLLTKVVSSEQGEVRGKVRLSHRCLALAVWNGRGLRRRQPF
jgi:hypothetical protein